MNYSKKVIIIITRRYRPWYIYLKAGDSLPFSIKHLVLCTELALIKKVEMG